MLDLLIFDLDGVITSEGKYWNTSRLTVWDIFSGGDFFSQALNSPERALKYGNSIISDRFIAQIKKRAVNSNWDLTYFVVCLYLISILERVPHNLDLPLLEQIQELGRKAEKITISDDAIIEQFWRETQSLQGSQVADYLIPFSQKILAIGIDEIFDLEQLWQQCYSLFQLWYEGKRGFILPDDETVLPVETIGNILSELAGRYDLGIATGRPRLEVIQPLAQLELLSYFNPSRIVTYDDVLQAQAQVNQKLGKPHPFILHKAMAPELPLAEILQENFTLEKAERVAYIGDAGSDVVAAKRASCLSIGVLTGFCEAATLQQLGCDMIVQDISALLEIL